MTPKTQSVCKHCGDSIRLMNGKWVKNEDSSGLCTHPPHEPVSEPASTGEPREVYERAHAAFVSEQVEQIGAARPSGPSAPPCPKCTKPMLQVGSKAPNTCWTCDCESSDTPSAPQTNAEPAHHERKYFARTGYLIAAPQPVSVDALEYVLCGNCSISNFIVTHSDLGLILKCNQCGEQKLIELGDAPKVEETCICKPKPLNGQHWPGCPDKIREAVRLAVFIAACKLDGGSPSTRPLTADGTKVLADAALEALPPYFPPASQTPTIEQLYEAAKVINSGDIRKDLFALEGLALHRHRDTGEMKYLIEALNCRVILKDFDRKFPDPLATPASTARTDGQYEKLFTAIQEAITCTKGVKDGACHVCIGRLADEYEKLFPDGVPQAEPPNIEARQHISPMTLRECMEAEEANKPPEHCAGCAKLEEERNKYRDESEFFQREMDNFRRNRDHRIMQLEAQLAGAAQPGDDKRDKKERQEP